MKRWIRVAVSLGLLTVIAILLPWGKVWHSLQELPPLVWAGVLAGFLLGHTLGVFKWRLFVNTGRAGLGLVDGIHCYAAGLFANLCLPSIVGGDVLRMAMAGRFTRRPEAAVWGGVMDRVTDVTALAVLVTAGGLLAHNALPGWGGQVVGIAMLIGLGLAALALPFALRRPLDRWPRRFRRPIGRSLVALRRLGRQPRRALAGFALSLTIQGGFVLLNAWLGSGIGVHPPLAAWFFVWPMAKVVSLLPISLGGLAVREASLAALLAPFGVPLELGVLTSLLWQTVLISGGLVGGAIWYLLGRRRRARDAQASGSLRSAAARGPNYA